jgi:hypothetical protein
MAAVSGALFTLLLLLAADRRDEERLSFQSHAAWSPRVNLNADVAIVYGIDATIADRIATWRNRGYRIHVMTGVAWGAYQDYLEGRWDGVKHWDEAQTTRNGSPILHGGSKDIPYISPGESYGRYLTEGVKRALDAGAEAIHLEEPEFWARSGYEAAFQREWKAYYKEDWQPPDSSPSAQYRASKLKYYLYRRALEQVFSFVRAYSREHGRDVRCYIPTHSTINYAHWRIVSPESSLVAAGADGYIAQVWTGTARTPNVYEGKREERTFETAFLEYGAMQNLARASGKRIWYLNDPIEDNPNHTWADYRANWENTLTASLLQPDVWHYEIMPWPDRIFKRNYPGPDPGLRIPIPKGYETELQAVIRAMGEMNQAPEKVRWLHAGMTGVGVLVSDTMMFQRAGPDPSDANLGSFYGLALPLLKRGIPVEPVQIETAVLDRYRLLLLTYEGQKPPAPDFHRKLANWVRSGGSLVIVDDGRDPYNKVPEWWNTAPNAFASPGDHLMRLLGLKADFIGVQRVGRGMVVKEAASPAALTYRPDGAEQIRTLVKKTHVAWKESAALVLNRGPYIVASGLANPPVMLRGRFVNLFDQEMKIVNEVTLEPGRRALLVDLDRADGTVIAAASRVRNLKQTSGRIAFVAEGIADTEAMVRIALRSRPVSVLADGKPISFQFEGGTVGFRFANSVDGVQIEVQFNGN